MNSNDPESPPPQPEAQPNSQRKSQPILNLPRSVTWFALLLLAIFAAYTLVLDDEGQLMLAVWFAYMPIRWTESGIPGGLWPLLWTPFTHALLHGSWTHVIMNVAWFAVFGGPVSGRYGAPKMFLVFFAGAAAGVVAFTLLNWGDLAILVGASGGIAGLTGVATRFVFQPVQVARDAETGAVKVLGRTLASWGELAGNPRSRFFVIFWVGINLAIPVYEWVSGAAGMQIAWQAHLGGFFAGLVLAPLLERRRDYSPA